MNNMVLTVTSPLSPETKAEIEKEGGFIISKKGIVGNEPIFDVIVEITLATLSLISVVALARIKARAKVSIKYKDVEIKGVSEEKLMQIIGELKVERDKIEPKNPAPTKEKLDQK
jgi:hypothetical protein